MTTQITRRRTLESLKEAASSPGADKNAVVTLTVGLIAGRTDAEVADFLSQLDDGRPQDATVLAAAGYFQARTRCPSPAG